MVITTEMIQRWSQPKKCDLCGRMIQYWSHSGVSCGHCRQWVCNECKDADNPKRCPICGRPTDTVDMSQIIY